MQTDVNYFNSKDVANMLGVNVSSVKRWTDEGKLECIKTAGGHRKFILQHLASFIENHKKNNSRVNLFPIESESDLLISHYILKGDFEYLQNFVLEKALECKREKVQQVLNGLYLGQYKLYEIYDGLLTPIFHKIGILWEKGEISVIQEHFASQTIFDCLIRLQGIIKIPNKKIGKAMCLNFATDLHDIVLKMVDHILEVRGFNVLYAGSNTPLFDIERIFEDFKPDRVYISSTIVLDEEIIQKEFDKLCNICKKFDSKIYIGGIGFNILHYDETIIEKKLETFEETFIC